MRNISNLLLSLPFPRSSVWIRVACVVICCFIVVSCRTVHVQAQNAPPVSVGQQASCSEEPAPPVLQGDSNVEKAFNYLVRQGLAPHQAAGIVGNLSEESYVNPSIQEGGALTPDYPIAGRGFGIAQWTPASRQQNLVDFAAKRNTPVNDLNIQLDFLWYEMTTVPGWKESLVSIRAAQTAGEAAFAFHRDFERSADTFEMIQERVAAAERILARYGQTPAPPPPTPVQCEKPSQIPDCTIYGIDGKIKPGQLDGNEAILGCARLFDPYGYEIATGNALPTQWIQWWEIQGEFKNRTFRPAVDCSSLVMMSIYLAYNVNLQFSTRTIDTMPQYFRKIAVADARPGDIMVRPGHMAIAVTNAGSSTFAANTASIAAAQQISEVQGGKWTTAYVYIGPGSTRK